MFKSSSYLQSADFVYLALSSKALGMLEDHCLLLQHGRGSDMVKGGWNSFVWTNLRIKIYKTNCLSIIYKNLFPVQKHWGCWKIIVFTFDCLHGFNIILILHMEFLVKISLQYLAECLIHEHITSLTISVFKYEMNNSSGDREIKRSVTNIET